MSFYKLRLCLIAIISFNTLSAQEYKLDKISEEDLSSRIYENDSTVPAVYIDKIRETYLDYDSTLKNWVFINEITERIKILNTSGLDYATKRIKLYKKEKREEEVEDVSGLTYNLDNGQIKKHKLTKEAIFQQEVSENFNESSFTLPDARVGSIVEWSYKTISPFYKIDDLILQENIPVLNYYAKVRTPGMFTFRRIKKGYFTIEPQESVKKRTLGISYNPEGAYGSRLSTTRNMNITFSEITAEFSKQNIPALKKEVFMNNPENYRMSVVYELVSTEFDKGNKREYATNWEEVAKSIFKSVNFGGQLERTIYLRDLGKTITISNTSTEDKITASLETIKGKMTWNGDYGKYTDQGLKKAFILGSGNVAEINLMLVALLREVGVNANPVLVSTKQYGIPNFPTLEGFNYVLAGVRDGGNTILLDATDKFSAPNILPTRVYNWYGRMINKDGISQEIDLFEDLKPSTHIFLNATLSKEGSLSGEVIKRYTGLDALDFRAKYSNADKNNYAEKEQEKLGLDAISNYKLKNLKELPEPVVETFNFKREVAVDIIGDKIVISPLLFFTETESPFKSDERQFPIDFEYPFLRDIRINIKIPEGYEVNSLPKAMRISLPNDMGDFLYTIVHTSGTLQIMARFNVKQHIIDSAFYFSLKEFFKLKVDKENERVILQKI
ncbi:transglutaminase [Leeuwenhoekiella sp. NPDC079379]|uniref:transglutaminase n=1 Tax=Leeuwenhoekiella sp. NPDC079379 TaxID=3364122 RepID=UPI0037C805CE